MASHSPQDLNRVSRRTFLRLTAGTTLFLPLVLSACTSASTTSAPATPASAGATPGTAAAGAPASGLPTFVASTGGPKPDLPSTGPGIDDGFTNYPANPTKSEPAAAPGAASTVSAYALAYYPPPTPIDQNSAWQEVNKQLNATVQFNIVAAADYPTRLAALMAGNDLPDMLLFNTGLGAAPNLPQFMQAQCSDLTPYLAGDAVKDYPNLAGLPTSAWRNSGSVIGGHVWTLPIARSIAGVTMLFNNSDIWDTEIGLEYAPKNADDFKRILTQLSRPQDNRWALGAYSVGTGFGVNYAAPTFAAMYGAPNNWLLDTGGKLVKDRETDEYKAGIGYARDLFAAGLYHPNQPSYTAPAVRADFLAGHVVVLMDALIAWNDFWLRGLQQTPQIHSKAMQPFPAQDGGKVVHHTAPGFQATTAFKKATPDRIKELLRISNWLAAPFGSQEDLLLTYGLAETDYTLDDKGNPTPTSRGVGDSYYVPWRFIVQHPYVWYNASLPDYARIVQGVEKGLLAAGVADPTVGYYSATYYGKGRSLEQTFVDGMNAIIAGNRPFTDYDQIVKDWVTNGGDVIRKEFMDSIAQAG
jgi:putative aldouronate transport system substrate-binding protein